jgi:hypothetical protein
MPLQQKADREKAEGGFGDVICLLREFCKFKIPTPNHMKKNFVCLCLCLLIATSCKKESPKEEEPAKGFNCFKGVCQQANDAGEYKTLDACQADCPNKPGKFQLNISWKKDSMAFQVPPPTNWAYYPCSYSCTLGIAVNSTDAVNGIFTNSQIGNAPFNYTSSDLSPGNYYYVVTLNETCHADKAYSKTGIITVKTAETVTAGVVVK